MKKVAKKKHWSERDPAFEEACREARKFARKHPTLQAAWDACPYWAWLDYYMEEWGYRYARGGESSHRHPGWASFHAMLSSSPEPSSKQLLAVFRILVPNPKRGWKKVVS